MEHKYKNGKIYKVTDVGYNKCYYGSTVQSLAMRMAKHRQNYRAYKEDKFHKITVFNMFDEYGIENCKIELVESFPCNSKEELESKEGFYIKNNDCVNRCVVGRTRKEYSVDNKEHLKEKRVEYHERYKEQIKEQRKEYRETNKEMISERGKEYYKDNRDKILERVKEYSEINKNKIEDYRKQYYEDNKDKLLEQQKEKYVCSVCGSCVRKSDKARHEKTKKHHHRYFLLSQSGEYLG